MGKPKVTEEDFKVAWYQQGCSAARVAEFLDIDISNVYSRRKRLADRGIILPTIPADGNCTGENALGRTDWQVKDSPYKQRIETTLTDGYAVIFSDAHFWPNVRSLAFESLLLVTKELKPKAVVTNGDALDGARISRHPPLGWHRQPSMREELHATQGYLGEVESAAPKAKKLFIVGNHDSRFDRYLATNAPEMEGVGGMSLAEHLPA